MEYTYKDIIEFVLEENPDVMQAFSKRKLADVFSDESFKPGEIKLERQYYDEDGSFNQFSITPYWKDVYKFNYNSGYYIYVGVDELRNWYLQRNRNLLLEDLGI